MGRNLHALPALALPFLIRAAVVQGIATATEVSTVGVVYTAFAGLFIYRQFNWRRLYPMTIVVFMILGSVLEGIPAIMLFGPLLFPAARALGAEGRREQADPHGEDHHHRLVHVMDGRKIIVKVSQKTLFLA
jgi:TRAP-type C4-dicarboxylate transport system permease large subunit